ncbi:MAG: hypothetical protein FWG30_09455 [Eubacteriaceae bacterium]|nr:hypothetical protein [Eubacteriaceae bacterium]
MQNAYYGVFKNGQIILNESIEVPDETSVIVVLLDDQNSQPPKNTLVNILDELVVWEDAKDAETIIAEIEKSRLSRSFDIEL